MNTDTPPTEKSSLLFYTGRGLLVLAAPVVLMGLIIPSSAWVFIAAALTLMILSGLCYLGVSD